MPLSKQNEQKKRPYYGGGMPKGKKTQKVISKEMAREALRQIVLREMDDLVSAQIANAKGIKYLVARNRHGGTFKRVVGAEERLKKGPGEDEIIEVWEKDPSIQAFSDLMNRAIDKPIEPQQVELNMGEQTVSLITQALHEARQRVAKAKRGNGHG